MGTEIEGERSDWGGSVSVWERKRRGVDKEREREREQSDPSCDEETQEKCIPQAESIRKAAKQPGELTTSFKSLHDHFRLALTSSGPAGSLHTLALPRHTRAGQPLLLCLHR